MIVGMTRIRNESLIIRDTIEHFLKWCGHIIVYDDCSTDDTVDIVSSFGDSVTLIRGGEWIKNRVSEETRHRALLLDRARELGHKWCLYFDADERLEGELPDFKASGYKFSLFDGYLTPECCEPYQSGRLIDIPRMWGPERRDITMLFRSDMAFYKGSDMRAPFISGPIELANIRVKHYGKCLSVEHWEEACDYYATYFPERYSKKWAARRGKAIHTVSDFGRPLVEWGKLNAGFDSGKACP